MSKQLSLSAAFSVFALAVLALSQGGSPAARAGFSGAPMETGATVEAAAPALPALDLPSWPSLSR